jgi:hypothetical protein
MPFFLMLCEESSYPGSLGLEVVTKVINNKRKFNRTKTTKFRGIWGVRGDFSNI